MSKWGLKYKGVEILTPEEWNAVVDALNDLDGRAPSEVKGGLATFDGDGSTTTFTIAHGMSAAPTAALVGKGAPNMPDVDYHEADASYIRVHFKAAPASGSGNVKIWWLAVRL